MTGGVSVLSCWVMAVGVVWDGGNGGNGRQILCFWRKSSGNVSSRNVFEYFKIQ